MPSHRILLIALALIVENARAQPPDPAQLAADEQVLTAAKVGTEASALLEFFRNRTPSPEVEARLNRLVSDLGSQSFRARRLAAATLSQAGTTAIGPLREALNDTDSERARAARETLAVIESALNPSLVSAAARILADRRPPEAVGVLLAYLPWAESEVVADDLRIALTELTRRAERPDPLLFAALTDPHPSRRGAAAEALARRSLPDLGPVLRVLSDSDVTVRMRAAVALAEVGERTAIPVLIELVGKLPLEQSWPAEDLLVRLARDLAPLPAAEGGPTARRDAWAGWWDRHGPTTDLARLREGPQVLGYTQVLMIDSFRNMGRLVELGANRKPRWAIDDLKFPLDAQMIGPSRVLIAEFQGNQVTERDLSGKVLWEKSVQNPIVAQRLPGGNTFIGSRNQLMEVTRDGKEVWSFSRPAYNIMSAAKTRDGRVLVVTSAGRCEIYDTAGKELRSFPVGRVQTFCRIELLPGGRVLIPEYGSNQVVEYDAAGKPVWQAEVRQPTSAMRLTNGHTLVASQATQLVQELDRSGKAVWEYRAEGQPWQARRR